MRADAQFERGLAERERGREAAAARRQRLQEARVLAERGRKLLAAGACGAPSLMVATVAFGWSGQVTPTKAGYTFVPASVAWVRRLPRAS